MKKSFKKIAIAVAILAMGLFSGYTYLMKGGGRNIDSEEPSYIISANNLSSDFTNDNAKATQKYINKVVEIGGKISGCKNNVVTFNQNIICQMQLKTDVKTGQPIKLKGRVLGYDDLMGELKLDQCYIIK